MLHMAQVCAKARGISRRAKLFRAHTVINWSWPGECWSRLQMEGHAEVLIGKQSERSRRDAVTSSIYRGEKRELLLPQKMPEFNP